MTTAPVPIISLDGSRCLGHIRERDREHIALSWPDEVLIGAFRTRKEAADAISAVHRTCRKTGGRLAMSATIRAQMWRLSIPGDTA